MKTLRTLSIVALVGVLSLSSAAQKKKNKNSGDDFPVKSSHLGALKFRNVGPSLTAGRIADMAVNPNNPSEYYLAIASGGVFKTTNSGVTFSPIFDSYGSYSTGCITIDPSNSDVLWLGSGENNNQRSVAYGDGVYKSVNGGSSWKNMGLKNSEHIHKIIVHPNNSNVVYVAANGPLWSSGGERGIYMTEDGGDNWKLLHNISENTGACDLVMDPNNPNVLVAAFHQRRRHVFTYLGGGPESTIVRTTDGGKTWKESKTGLPSVDIGRIGLAWSPVEKNLVYAIVEAAQGKGGFFRSTNGGMTWNKMSGRSTSGNYYQEIVCHPTDKDIVFSMDTWLHHTEDGGKTFKATGEDKKHVDNHCMWIDPNDTKHWRVGCDGGLYETWDAARTWEFKANLPITQFYKVAVDNDVPFYNIYGGTQDNNSMGGPSRTINNAGILNSDWFITNGGDGFESAIDTENPNIVYAQAQYGWLVRYDKQSGERVAIQPQHKKGEAPYRWNWDAPLMVSPHKASRIYFAANKLFMSEDRGDTWQIISPDLTQQIDRNKLPVMGKVWSIDAVMKNMSTTIYGNIVALDESPVKEGLLYVGTDDGLIQVSEDNGANWRKISSFPGVPANTYVNQIIASQFDENVVYACFNDHKRGNFKPYILMSKDRGRTWTSITGNLPERGTVYTIAQDHKVESLLFCGTEFGMYTSLDAGAHWIKMGAGLPTIGIRDIAIQRRENDIVLASFGRGFYVLDDYTPLRTMSEEILDKESHLFPTKKALMYVESNPLGLRGVGSQGASLYTAENPQYGTHFTFYLKNAPKKAIDARREEEKEKIKNGEAIPFPSFEDLRIEATEEDAYLVFVVKENGGDIVKKIKAPAREGVQRVVWNHRYSTTTPVKKSFQAPGRYGMADDGFLAVPGTYKLDVYLVNNGEVKELQKDHTFEIEYLNNKTLPAADKNALTAFYKDLSEMRRKVRGSAKLMSETNNRLSYIKAAIASSPNTDLKWMQEVENLEAKLYDLGVEMWGDGIRSKYQFESPEGFASRLEYVVWSMWSASSAPTSTSKEQLSIAKEEYASFIDNLHATMNSVEALEKKLDSAGAGYTPGRGTEWKRD